MNLSHPLQWLFTPVCEESHNSVRRYRLSLSRWPPRNLAGLGLKWERTFPRSRKYPSFFGHPPRTRDIAPKSSWQNNRFFGFSAQSPLWRLNARLQANLGGSEFWQRVPLLQSLTSLRWKISVGPKPNVNIYSIYNYHPNSYHLDLFPTLGGLSRVTCIRWTQIFLKISFKIDTRAANQEKTVWV